MTEDKKYLEEQFISFIIMLSQSVMLHLGKIANPLSGKIEKNLEGAKATIDLLIMLKEKTKGNLSDREEKFFATTLSTLQMNYVDEIKKEPTPKQDPSTSSGQDPSAGSGQDPSAGSKQDPSTGTSAELSREPSGQAPSPSAGREEGPSPEKKEEKEEEGDRPGKNEGKS